ncbi:MAG: 50S ribosomal protein L24 [Deltaproteobacteria bacterium RIFCSPHIGHO2_02_FULL_50_15]|nr:MAG: 50S ribosomal protein L24 [Deltaproteobacteria bacterium RIFCSPHIGHO2_02_FULL_50_15]
MRKIKVGDLVQVITGAEKGKQGKILRFNKEASRLFIEKVKLVKRHTRPTQKNPQGGTLEKEASLHISNVMLVDPKTKKPGRVSIQRGKNTPPLRVFKKTGTELK